VADYRSNYGRIAPPMAEGLYTIAMIVRLPVASGPARRRYS
jgi:hypothetical protein